MARIVGFGLLLGATALGVLALAGVPLPLPTGLVATGLAPQTASLPASLPASVRVAPSWKRVAPGVEMRRWNAEHEDGTVAVVALRTRPAHVRIVAGATLDAAAWRRKAGALAAINGGFFDPSGRSLGLRVARGRRLSRLHPADWGVFAVRHERARIVHTRDFTSRRGVSEAIQCGPRLVVDGRPLRLKPQWARRSGIGVRRDGQVVVAVADGAMSFRAWAALWAARDGLGCRDALNLDGGGSTQMSLRSPHDGAKYADAERDGTQTVEIGGAWPVPDAVIIR